ncbi:hypothetical protein EX30DRAFT_349975 [Ascodesmis nigricans]|uniref:Uncharacterized protein n=1 Tax=Ascodesmis nigricans TaxID=341454 RepID=A0A4S2MTD6_9PEZI|nr:hypothetical protein EX30DRAFT_349975 [Ascodesmis nigricans]
MVGLRWSPGGTGGGTSGSGLSGPCEVQSRGASSLHPLHTSTQTPATTAPLITHRETRPARAAPVEPLSLSRYPAAASTRSTKHKDSTKDNCNTKNDPKKILLHPRDHITDNNNNNNNNDGDQVSQVAIRLNPEPATSGITEHSTPEVTAAPNPDSGPRDQPKASALPCPAPAVSSSPSSSPTP